MGGGVTDGWYQVTLPYACCGVRVASGKIAEATPILRWSEGKLASGLMAWAKRKGGSMEPLRRSDEAREVE